MAAPTLRNAASRDRNSPSTDTSAALPSLPSAAIAGNGLLVIVAVDKSAGTFAAAPAGWTKLIEQVGASVSLCVIGKVASGGETTAPVVSWSTSTNGFVAVIQEWQQFGSFGATQLPAYSNTERTSMVLDPPAVGAAGGRVLAIFANDTNPLGTVSGSGFTTAYASPQTDGGEPAATTMQSGELAGGQSLPSTTFSWGTFDQTIGAALVLESAPAVEASEGSGTGTWEWTGTGVGIAPALDASEGSGTGIWEWTGTGVGVAPTVRIPDHVPSFAGIETSTIGESTLAGNGTGNVSGIIPHLGTAVLHTT